MFINCLKTSKQEEHKARAHREKLIGVFINCLPAAEALESQELAHKLCSVIENFQHFTSNVHGRFG